MSIVPTRRALVVDDSRAARIELARLIEPYGFDVDLAEDGSAALRLLVERGPYDLVLTDLRMPNLDGHELLRIMRARGDRTPVVLLAAVVQTRLVASTLKLGAADFVVKPPEADAVRRALARALELPGELLRAETPRVLAAGEEDCAAALTSALPGYVQVDRVARGQVLEAVRERPYRLVVMDLRAAPPAPEAVAAFEADATATAAAVLGVQPGAALCCVRARGVALQGFDTSVPLEDLAPAVLDSLYPNAVRPLVVHDEVSVSVMGFRGLPMTEPTYFAVAERRLRAATALVVAAGSPGIVLDLSRVPARSAAIERLVAAAVAASDGRAPGLRVRVTAAMAPSFARTGLPITVEVAEPRAHPARR